MPKKILLSGTVGFEINVEDISKKLEAAKGQDVIFEISSGGGSVFEGLAISNLIKNFEGHTTAHIIGLAASMATKIAVSADKVTAESDAVFMIHNSSGIVFGDNRDMAKMARTLGSIDDLLARSLTEKAGRPKAEIVEEMDAETFFFGEEIVEAGFADEIIGKKDKSKDKKASLSDAVLNIKACQDTLKTLEIKDDYEQIAAILKKDAPYTNTQEPEPVSKTRSTRKSANNQQSTEVKNMDLTKFLADNLEAKKEFDTLLKAEFKKGANSIEARIDRVSPILNGSYPEAIKAQGMKAIKGDISTDTFDAIVAMHDMQNEGKNSQAAADETGEQGSTQSQDHEAISEGGEIKTEADRVAMVARLKKSQGGY